MSLNTNMNTSIINESEEVTLRLLGALSGLDNTFMAECEDSQRILIEATDWSAPDRIMGRDIYIMAQLCIFPLIISNQAEPANPLEEAMTLLFGGGGFAAPIIEPNGNFFTTLEASVVGIYDGFLDVSTGFGRVPLVISEEDLKAKDIQEGSDLMVDARIVAKVLEVLD